MFADTWGRDPPRAHVAKQFGDGNGDDETLDTPGFQRTCYTCRV